MKPHKIAKNLVKFVRVVLLHLQSVCTYLKWLLRKRVFTWYDFAGT